MDAGCTFTTTILTRRFIILTQIHKYAWEWLKIQFVIHVPQYSRKKFAFNISSNNSRFALSMDRSWEYHLLGNLYAPHMSTQGFTNFDFSLFGFA